MTKSNNSLISIIPFIIIFPIEALVTKNDSIKAGVIENQLMIRIDKK